MKSARETVVKPSAKTPPRKKVAAVETARHQLRSFAPWVNRFGCALLRRMIKDTDEQNVAVASNTLLVLAGALSYASSNEDADEACEALFGKSPTGFDKLAMEMFKLFDDQASCKWEIQDVIFLPWNRKPNEEYCDKISDKFGVETRSVSGKNPSDVVTSVNKYVEKKSQNRMSEVMTSEDASGLKKYMNCMQVVTAVYVHPWFKSQFDKTATADETFYVDEKKTIQVKMMHQESSQPYVQADLCPGVSVQVLGMTCRSDVVAVYYILPVDRFKLTDVISNLTGDRAARLIDYCRPRRVRIAIPRMQMPLTTELRKSLSGLGVEAWLNLKRPAFEGFAEKGGSVSLGQVYHHVVLKINEDGDPGGTIEKAGEEEQQAVDFKCDQPFLVMIQHRVTSGIWLIAQVKEPISEAAKSTKKSPKKEEK